MQTTTGSGRALMDYYVNEIYENLRKILIYKTIYKYNLAKLFGRDSSIMVKSPDRKPFCFYYDQNTGGSYHSQASIVPYQEETGKVYNFFSMDEQSQGDSSNIFYNDGYGVIDALFTREGIKYLLQGSVITCNSCSSQYIQLVTLKKRKI